MRDRFFVDNFKSFCRNDLAPVNIFNISIYLGACKAACPYIDLVRSYAVGKVRPKNHENVKVAKSLKLLVLLL